jgi:hypothetical protein
MDLRFSGQQQRLCDFKSKEEILYESCSGLQLRSSKFHHVCAGNPPEGWRKDEPKRRYTRRARAEDGTDQGKARLHGAQRIGSTGKCEEGKCPGGTV